MSSSDTKGFVILYVILLLWFVISLIRGSKLRAVLRNFAIWCIIYLAILLLYSYRFEIKGVQNRLIGTIFPAEAINTAPGEIVINRSTDGQYYTYAYIDNIKLHFIVDTGASNITICQKDAKKLGYNVNKLDYSEVYHTANGVVKGAPITLSSVQLGKAVFHNVQASVNGGGLNISLLGMNFLNRFDSFTFKNDSLILSYKR